MYTGLLAAAVLVLAAGVFLLAKQNIDHSAVDNQPGGLFKLVQ